MARQRSDERPRGRGKTLPEKQLSPSEWRLMQACWKLGRTTIRDILLEIADLCVEHERAAGAREENREQ